MLKLREINIYFKKENKTNTTFRFIDARLYLINASTKAGDNFWVKRSFSSWELFGFEE